MAGSPDRIVVGGGCSASPVRRRGATFPAAAVLGERLELPVAGQGVLVPVVERGLSRSRQQLRAVDRRRPADVHRRTAVPVIPPATDLLCTSDTTCFASSGRLAPAHDGRRSYLDPGGGVQPAALRPRAGGRHDALALARPSSCSRAPTAVRRGSEGGGGCARRRLRLDPLLGRRQPGAPRAAERTGS